MIRFPGYILNLDEAIAWVQSRYNCTPEADIMLFIKIQDYLQKRYRFFLQNIARDHIPVILVATRPAVQDPSATRDSFESFDETERDLQAKQVLNREGFKTLEFTTYAMTWP